MKVKLFSVWAGERPEWYVRFALQMKRYKLVDWEILPPDGVAVPYHVQWLTSTVSKALGTPCRKGGRYATCDLRPFLGDVFKDKLVGYDWWGWCDLDIRFGDLDNMLPNLLTDDCDVVNFKAHYLSGCFVLLRNIPLTRELYKHSDHWQTILADERYYVWDESGHDILPGESFYNTMIKAGVRIKPCEELYSYDTAEDRSCNTTFKDGKIIMQREVLFHHFMSNKWPGD